jgi:hypothetical protein
MTRRALGWTLVAIAAVLVLLVVQVESCSASRLYPTVGAVYRYEWEEDEKPRPALFAQGAVALSLGRLAPRLTLRANHRRAEIELSAVVRLGQ